MAGVKENQQAEAGKAGHGIRGIWWRHSNGIGCLGSILLLVAAGVGVQNWWEHLPHPWAMMLPSPAIGVWWAV
jgi:hypothetical protein